MGNILEIIKQSGESVATISKKTGVSYDKIMGWIHRGATPKHEDAKKILAYFGKIQENTKTKPFEVDAVLNVLLVEIAKMRAGSDSFGAVSNQLEYLRNEIAQEIKRLSNTSLNNT